MQTHYIVTYDICHPKRLRRVYLTMRGFGAHIQYSVFRCDLSAVERARMIGALQRIINSVEDQVLLIRVGPSGGPRARSSIESVGRPYIEDDRHDIVI